jgi:hypothetical protein
MRGELYGDGAMQGTTAPSIAADRFNNYIKQHVSYKQHFIASIMGGESSHRNMSGAKDYPKLAAGPVGKQIHSIYQSRLRQFVDSGQYKEQGLVG